jgi:hypothetical protein
MIFGDRTVRVRRKQDEPRFPAERRDSLCSAAPAWMHQTTPTDLGVRISFNLLLVHTRCDGDNETQHPWTTVNGRPHFNTITYRTSAISRRIIRLLLLGYLFGRWSRKKAMLSAQLRCPRPLFTLLQGDDVDHGATIAGNRSTVGFRALGKRTPKEFANWIAAIHPRISKGT